MGAEPRPGNPRSRRGRRCSPSLSVLRALGISPVLPVVRALGICPWCVRWVSRGCCPWCVRWRSRGCCRRRCAGYLAGAARPACALRNTLVHSARCSRTGSGGTGCGQTRCWLGM